MSKYTLSVRLTILGPFLTASSNASIYGVNKVFYRNSDNQPTIPASHIKGKLRMSLEELSAMADVGAYDAKLLFGEENSEGVYIPAYAMLRFSDFNLVPSNNKQAAGPQTRKRTAIDSVSGTAAKNQLREIEDLFKSGSSTVWEGNITFFAEEKSKAEELAQLIKSCFCWIPNFGSEKGVGFGRLHKVEVELAAEEQKESDINLEDFKDQKAVHLRIQPHDLLMIGGVKHPRSNIVQSEKIIPGSVIKGALASGLNQFHELPSYTPLSKAGAEKLPGFELLAEWFDRIRVTHAFPVNIGEPRPVKKPISMVEVDGKEYDLALAAVPEEILIDGKAPAYFIDQKKHSEYFGGALPWTVYETHVEIEDVSRRSKEGNLFTYAMLRAKSGGVDSPKDIEWVADVDFSLVELSVRDEVVQQFLLAVSTHLDRLGKLNKEVKVQIKPGYSARAHKTKQNPPNDEAVITLQSNALMLNPEWVVKIQSPPKKGVVTSDSKTESTDDLFSLYKKFWREVSASNSDPCLELVDFYAHQTFQGGYLFNRFARSSGNGEAKDYYPYYLTASGSVFRLKILDEQRARKIFEKWSASGLDLPSWVQEQYDPGPERQLWQVCPFVPENGYGEIAINLNCHWPPLPENTK